MSTAFDAHRLKSLSLRSLLSGIGWPGHLSLLGLGWLLVLLIFARDVGDMVSIWWNASTFNHCLFIPFLAAWLVAQRKGEVAGLTPQSWLPGVGIVFIASLVWMVGEAAGLGQLRHIGVVLMLQSLVLAILGPNVTRALLFPIFYLSFMVPAGEELVPLLQTITAKMSMALLALADIPAHINGIFITTPNGYFEVAEACSGVKFLVAMVAYGALVCNLCFRSWKRRMAFMACAIIVPILANGVRAFATIYVAHFKGVEAAQGFDHVVYGWFFFGLVMALVMAIGWRFFDRAPGDRWLDGFKPLALTGRLSAQRILGFSVFAVIAPFLWQATIASMGRVDMPNQLSLPALQGWSLVEPEGTAWSPHYQGADHQLLGQFSNSAGDRVDLSITLYGWQEEGREMIGYGQGIARPDGLWTWTEALAAPANGKADRIVAPGPINREVFTFYVNDQGQTGSASVIKLDTAKHRIFGGDQAVAVIHISAQEQPERPARAVLEAFMKSLGSPDDLASRLIRQARGS